MGYGTNLKEAIDKKDLSVVDLAKMTGTSKTTLYSAIQRDSALRYDVALRVANALDIDINLICKSNPYAESDFEELPGLLPEMNGLLTNANISSYVKNRTLPILKLLGYAEMPNMDKLISYYYSFTDNGRKQLFDMMEAMAKSQTDPERKAKLNEIKK